MVGILLPAIIAVNIHFFPHGFTFLVDLDLFVIKFRYYTHTIHTPGRIL